jgi:hypothetical protein
VEVRWHDPTALPLLVAPVLQLAEGSPTASRKELASRAAQ